MDQVWREPRPVQNQRTVSETILRIMALSPMAEQVFANSMDS